MSEMIRIFPHPTHPDTLSHYTTAPVQRFEGKCITTPCVGITCTCTPLPYTIQTILLQLHIPFESNSRFLETPLVLWVQVRLSSVLLDPTHLGPSRSYPFNRLQATDKPWILQRKIERILLEVLSFPRPTAPSHPPVHTHHAIAITDTHEGELTREV